MLRVAGFVEGLLLNFTELRVSMILTDRLHVIDILVRVCVVLLSNIYLTFGTAAFSPASRLISGRIYSQAAATPTASACKVRHDAPVRKRRRDMTSK